MRKLSVLAGVSLAMALGGAVTACGGGGGGGGSGPVLFAPPPSALKPRIAADPLSLSFNAIQGLAAPDSQSILVWNAGAGTTSWTATSSAAWLKATPSSGSAVNTVSTVVTVSVDVTGVSTGLSTATLTITETGGTSVVVSVSLNVFAPPAGISPVAPGITTTIRPDVLTGASVQATSLQDRLFHPYVTPAIAGTTYSISVDTTPRSPVYVEIDEFTVTGAIAKFVGTTTVPPFSTSVAIAQDGELWVSVYDPNQASVTLAKLTVAPTQRPYDTTRFSVVVHFVGDSFLGAGTHNNLATSTDQAAFASDLAGRVNAILSQAGVQIDSVGFDSISTATAKGISSSLVDDNGLSVLPELPVQQSLSTLGADAADPTFGRALDLFVLHNSRPNPLGLLTIGRADAIASSSRGLGGVFTGRGARTSVVASLCTVDVDSSGSATYQPNSMDDIASTVTHEIGHFLSLNHTTESSFAIHGFFPGTPFTPLSDFNKNGTMDTNEIGADVGNLMFWLRGVPNVQQQTTLTQAQINGIRGYLAIREH